MKIEKNNIKYVIFWEFFTPDQAFEKAQNCNFLGFLFWYKKRKYVTRREKPALRVENLKRLKTPI